MGHKLKKYSVIGGDRARSSSRCGRNATAPILFLVPLYEARAQEERSVFARISENMK